MPGAELETYHLGSFLALSTQEPLNLKLNTQMLGSEALKTQNG